MITGISYLPMYFKDGLLVPANHPFILTKGGEIKYLRPNKSILKTFILYRKFPVFMKSDYAGRMKGGKFQAADNPGFTNSVTIYTIPFPETDMKWYDISIILPQPYRYYRYLSPDGGWGNIAEVGFYLNGKKVIGKVIGTPGSYNDKPEITFVSAMDGDEATYFDFNKPNGG